LRARLNVEDQCTIAIKCPLLRGLAAVDVGALHVTGRGGVAPMRLGVGEAAGAETFVELLRGSDRRQVAAAPPR
jgi:hypothetical protein